MNRLQIPIVAIAALALIQTSPAETVGVTDLEYQNVKLEGIVIPEVEFDATPFSQAIEFIRTKSVELDQLEPDPSKKGVNLVLLREIQELIHSSDGGPLISLRVREMSLGAILRYVAQIAGCELDVHPEAVVIGSPEEIGQMRGVFGIDPFKKANE